MEQVHQHPTLMILSRKENGQHLDFSLLKTLNEPIPKAIQSLMAKGRQKIVLTFSAEGNGRRPLGQR